MPCLVGSLRASSSFGEVARSHARAARERIAAHSRVLSRLALLSLLDSLLADYFVPSPFLHFLFCFT